MAPGWLWIISRKILCRKAIGAQKNTINGGGLKPNEPPYVSTCLC